MVKKLSKKVSIAYRSLGQYLGAALNAPKQVHAQVALFMLGACLLASGLSLEAAAQGHQIQYNDGRLTDSVNVVLTYIEGSFGALVMVAAGIGAILSSAFGQYRAALSLLVVAIGAFILRSIIGAFFNDTNIQA
ncbi:MAG: hypothetical protein R3A13_02205 [Bdellovibrionota bacterium]